MYCKTYVLYWSNETSFNGFITIARALVFCGQPKQELWCQNDKKCDNFVEFVLVTSNGNIESVESTI